MRIGIFTNSTKTDHIILAPILYGTSKPKKDDLLSFGEALDALKLGFKIKRKPWGEEYLVLIEFGNQGSGDRKAGVVKLDEEDYKVLYSYIALSTPDIFLPWSATHVDLLEDDWMII